MAILWATDARIQAEIDRFNGEMLDTQAAARRSVPVD